MNLEESNHENNWEEHLGGSGIPGSGLPESQMPVTNNNPNSYEERFDEIYQEFQRLVDNSDEFGYFEPSFVAKPASEFGEGNRVIEDLETNDVMEYIEEFNPSNGTNLAHIEAEKEIKRTGNMVDAKVVLSSSDITSYDMRKTQATSDPTDYMGMEKVTETVNNPGSLPKRRSKLRDVDINEDSEMKLILEYGTEF